MKYILVFIIVTLLVRSNLNAQVWKNYADSAKSYQDQRNNTRAVAFYQQAIDELKKDSAGTVTHAIYTDRLGFLYFAMGNYKIAEPVFIEVIQMREKLFGKEHKATASSMDNLGILYMNMGEQKKAEPLMIEARNIRERILGKAHADYATSCNNLGMLYKNMGQYSRAEPFYIEAMQVREKVFGKEAPEYANSLNNLGILYLGMGDYEKVEPLYLETARIREKVYGKQHPMYAASLNNLAAYYRVLGQYKKAEPLYIESMQIRGGLLGKEHPDYAASLNNLAVLYWAMGRFEKVEPLHLEAIRIREKVFGKKSEDYSNSANNLATYYKEMGQYEKAERLYLETNMIREQVLGKEHPEYAISLNNLAILYSLMGKLERSEPLYVEARRIRSLALGTEHPDYGNSSSNLGILYARMKQYDKARSFLLESYQVYEKAFGKEHPEFANSADNLANIYNELGEYEKAENLYLVSRQVWENKLGNTSMEYITNTSNLARLYWGQQNTDKAYEHFMDAARSREKNIKNVFRFSSEKEKQSYGRVLQDMDDKALSFSLSAYPHSLQGFAYDRVLATRNLILSSSQQLRLAIRASADTLLSNKYNEWIQVKEQLAFWMSQPIDKRNGRDIMFEEKANTLEKDLTRLSSEFRQQQEQQSVTWRNVQEALKINECAIEFQEIQYCSTSRTCGDSIYYVALLIKKGMPEPKMIPLFEKTQLDSIMHYKGTSASKVLLGQLYKSPVSGKNNALYEIIWQPVEKELAGINTIYFSPAGSLHKLSFAAFPINAKQVLSDKYQLIQLSTTASVGEPALAGFTGSDKIILYGGVQYSADSTSIKQAAYSNSSYDVASRSLPDDLLRDAVGEFYYLAGTNKEVEDIGRLAKQKKFNISVFNGLGATEESFKGLTENNSPALLHIATHGFFFPDPVNNKKDDGISGAMVFKQSDDPLMRSGLALAGATNAWKGKPVTGIEDGILTSYEVSNMYLPNTKLAVLSACETGLGDIQGSEGVYGLQRAFKMGGVKNLVMSLWKVPDVETAEFMQEFYKNLFNKKTISDAFQLAQSVMKNKYRADPYKWAAWILVR